MQGTIRHRKEKRYPVLYWSDDPLHPVADRWFFSGRGLSREAEAHIVPRVQIQSDLLEQTHVRDGFGQLDSADQILQGAGKAVERVAVLLV